MKWEFSNNQNESPIGNPRGEDVSSTANSGHPAPGGWLHPQGAPHLSSPGLTGFSATEVLAPAHPRVSTPWRGHILTPSCPLPRFVANVVDLSIFLPTLMTLFYFSTQKHLRSSLPLCLNGCYFSCLIHYSFCMQTTPRSRRPGSFSLKPMTCLPPALSKPTLLFFTPFFFWPAHAEGLRFGSGVTSSRKPALMGFFRCAPIAQYRSLYGSQS